MGLFRRKKEDEPRVSRIERYRQWRERWRERGFEKEMRELEREKKRRPLLEERAKAEELRTHISRARELRKGYGGGRGRGLMRELGAIGEGASKVSSQIFGEPQAERRPYTGNPFAEATSALAPPKPKKKKPREKTIVIKVE